MAPSLSEHVLLTLLSRIFCLSQIKPVNIPWSTRIETVHRGTQSSAGKKQLIYLYFSGYAGIVWNKKLSQIKNLQSYTSQSSDLIWGCLHIVEQRTLNHVTLVSTVYLLVYHYIISKINQPCILKVVSCATELQHDCIFVVNIIIMLWCSTNCWMDETSFINREWVERRC